MAKMYATEAAQRIIDLRSSSTAAWAAWRVPRIEALYRESAAAHLRGRDRGAEAHHREGVLDAVGEA